MKKALIYSTAVCAVSWIAALVFHLVTGYNGLNMSDLKALTAFQTFCTGYMFLPLLVAVVMQMILGEAKWVRKHKLRFRLSTASNPIFTFRWHKSMLAAVGVTLLLVALSILFSAPFAEVVSMKDGILASLANSGVDLSTLPEEELAKVYALPSWVMLLATVVSGLLAGLTINSLFALGEEYGWRGYMVTALKGEKFLPAALLIGTVWGIWHAPLILMGHNGYPNRPLGIVMMVIFCILGGIVELYFVLKSGSVWPAVFIHGTINALAGLGVLMIPGGNSFLTGMTGIAGFMAFAVVILGIYIYDRHISHERILSRPILENNRIESI